MTHLSRGEFLRGLAAGSAFLLAERGWAEDTGNRLLIVGGTVVDGTGKASRVADVRVVGDRIAEIGKLKPRKDERVIDAHGQIVAPGFIDAHSHVDGGLLDAPDAEAHIRQGITTSIVGQDGGSHLPLKDWFAQVEAKHVALNIASFVGHGTVRSAATGADYKRTVTAAELDKMRALVAQEMEAGALGLSSGLEYDPGFYATTDELVACAEVAGKHGGLYISHVRDEGDKAQESFDELITIARRGHLPAQISHIKLDTSPSWGRAPNVLQKIEDANRQGLDISADVYPYLFWQSTITVLIPSRDWNNRMLWQQGLAEVGGPEHVRLTEYTPDPSWKNKTLADLTLMTGKDTISLIQEIVQKTHGEGATGQESVVVTAMTEGDLERFIASPRIMFCTDGSLKPSHPRGAGSFPRILAVYVREKKILTLEQAIHKMSGLPAKRFGLMERGTLERGKKADLVLFDPASVADTATIENPASAPVGLPTVIVNGVPVLASNQLTGAHPGQVLRRRR